LEWIIDIENVETSPGMEWRLKRGGIRMMLAFQGEGRVGE